MRDKPSFLFAICHKICVRDDKFTGYRFSDYRFIKGINEVSVAAGLREYLLSFQTCCPETALETCMNHARLAATFKNTSLGVGFSPAAGWHQVRSNTCRCLDKGSLLI